MIVLQKFFNWFIVLKKIQRCLNNVVFIIIKKIFNEMIYEFIFL